MKFSARVDRRTALKWMLAASSALLVPWPAYAGDQDLAAHGYGTDPDLRKASPAGELWPLTLTEAQRRTAAALCDLILPREDEYPAASEVGVVDFIDEWISAPYAQQKRDRATVLEGFGWLDAEAARRFRGPFAALDLAEQAAIADDICSLAAARAEFKQPARFFATYRNLTSGGYYTTPQGMKDIGYVGNTPLAEFNGPPLHVLRQVGLA